MNALEFDPNKVMQVEIVPLGPEAEKYARVVNGEAAGATLWLAAGTGVDRARVVGYVMQQYTPETLPESVKYAPNLAGPNILAVLRAYALKWGYNGANICNLGSLPGMVAA